MGSRILYYLFIYPLSHLPLNFLYLLSDCFYVLLISIFPYRRKTVKLNLAHAFPQKSKRELKTIQRKFYRHFSDLLAEGVKNISMSKTELLKRFKVKNPEVLEDFYKKKQSVLLVSGHYNNWEWFVALQEQLFKQKAMGIGTPLTNRFWDKKLNEHRSRFGMKIIEPKEVDQFYRDNPENTATLILADQSPLNPRKSYWMNFLSQTTAVFFGPEMIAQKYNYAVVFFHVIKKKRGYYEMELELVTAQPRSLAWGELTELHVKSLETIIQNRPEYWLWSHNRWKLNLPNDILALKKKQRASFNSRFNNSD